MNDAMKLVTKNLFRNDPEIEFRIKSDTERHRKGFGMIVLQDENGKEIKNATIRLKLKKHEFQFGCNAFMYDEFETSDQNAAYAEKFKDIFNLAVIPFYWSDFEPMDGAPRFERNSPKVYRRPPTDLLLEYCEKNNITPKGHPLHWQAFYPEWAPREPRKLMDRIERRFAEIAKHYSGKICNFDVINEQLACPFGCPMPPEQIEFTFKLAEKYFSAGTVLNYNDTTDNSWGVFRRDYTPIDMLVQRLLDKRLKVDCLGLQYHMFCQSPEKMLQDNYQWTYYNPEHLFWLMDQHSKLGIPINVSEITIPGPDIFGGDEAQCEIAERLYRIWFSHPSNMGIIWWNMVDGTAAFAPKGTYEGENYYKAGILNYDFSEKPIAKMMRRLFKEEWHTDVKLEYHAGELAKFHGFYGDYDMIVKTDEGVFNLEFGLYKNILNHCVFKLKK